MAETTNKVSFWRGTRAQYEALGENTNVNTYYTVREEDGRWSYFYGPQIILSRSGQLMPAKDLIEVSELDDVKSGMTPGKVRYIVHDPEKTLGVDYPTDYTGYLEIEKRVDGRLSVVFLEPGVSVRIGGKKNFKTFQVTETEGFRSYDDGNCGEY